MERKRGGEKERYAIKSLNVFCQQTQFDTLKIDWLFSVCWKIMFLMYQCKYMSSGILCESDWVIRMHMCTETFCRRMFPFSLLGVTKCPLSGFGNILAYAMTILPLFPLFGPISQTWNIVPLLLRGSSFVELCPSINQIYWVVYCYSCWIDRKSVV